LQRLRNPSSTSGDNLKNESSETRTMYRHKKREYLKAETINEFRTNSKNKNIRDLNRSINGIKKVDRPKVT